MSVARKPDTLISFGGQLNVSDDDLELTINAVFDCEITGEGAIKDRVVLGCPVSVPIAAGDTTAQIAAKIKTAVDDAIAAG